MKSVKVYDIVTEDGQTLADIQLEMHDDYEWIDIFRKLDELTGQDVDSYSSHEVEQYDGLLTQLVEQRPFKP